MVQEISRGRFSSVTRCVRQDDQRNFACKIFDTSNGTEEATKEFEIVKALRHERLATLYEAYHLPKAIAFVMELLSGRDVLSFLASKLQYSEQNVAIVIKQVI